MTERIVVGGEGYFNMPNDLNYEVWKQETGLSDEKYIETIFNYIMEYKIPKGVKLVAIEHKVGPKATDEAKAKEEIKANIESVKQVLKRDWPEGEVAIAPFLFCLKVLKETSSHQRALGLLIDKRFFMEKGLISRVLLCGDTLSSGIKMAVGWAQEFGIPISCDNPEMKTQFDMHYNQ